VNKNQHDRIISDFQNGVLMIALPVIVGLALYIGRQTVVQDRVISNYPDYPSLCLGYSNDGSMIFLINVITNGLASTNYVNGVTNKLSSTNWVSTDHRIFPKVREDTFDMPFLFWW
jgi:hypothetical protein